MFTDESIFLRDYLFPKICKNINIKTNQIVFSDLSPPLLISNLDIKWLMAREMLEPRFLPLGP